MGIFDPFYGVSRTGVAITKWLNRLLILAELGYVAFFMYWYRVGYGQPLEWYYYAGLAVLVPIAMTIVNVFVRKLWNLVLVFRYGTSDERVIVDYYQQREKRYEEKMLKKRNRYLAQLEKQARAKEISNVEVNRSVQRY